MSPAYPQLLFRPVCVTGPPGPRPDGSHHLSRSACTGPQHRPLSQRRAHAAPLASRGLPTPTPAPKTLTTTSPDLPRHSERTSVRAASAWNCSSIPSPYMTPTDVIESQLFALRVADLDSVFNHASPQNKLHTGPFERFAKLFQMPEYQPLIHNSRWQLVSALTLSEWNYTVNVIVYPAGSSAAAFAGPRPAKYSWALSKQIDDDVFDGCWMVDSVTFQGFAEDVSP